MVRELAVQANAMKNRLMPFYYTAKWSIFMPELPEVETIRRSLQPTLVHRRITRFDVMTNGVLIQDHLPRTGWQIRSIGRRGKYLIMALRLAEDIQAIQEAQLIVHLRMTGQLLIRSDETEPKKHTHIRLQLEDAQGQPVWLDFNDTRRFGRFWLLANHSIQMPAGLVSLGPEPLDDDFTPACLAQQLRSHPKLTLKAALLNQTIVAGLGNIYADESLFAARLAPMRQVSSLSETEIERLTQAIRQILSLAVDLAGTTLSDYVDGWNRKGKFQEQLCAYSRSGQGCRVCGTTLKSIRLAGRTTCWCPSCQPEP